MASVESQDRDYASRKFLITGLTILCATGMAYFDMMSNNLAMVYVAGIASYNWANSRTAKKAKKEYDSGF